MDATSNGATVRFASAEDAARARERWQTCQAATSTGSRAGAGRPLSSREQYQDSRQRTTTAREREQPHKSLDKSADTPEAQTDAELDQRTRAQELAKEIAWYGKD